MKFDNPHQHHWEACQISERLHNDDSISRDSEYSRGLWVEGQVSNAPVLMHYVYT